MKVLLTGAFGNVGSSALIEMCVKGFDVTAFELDSAASRKRYNALRKKYKFKTIWGNLMSQESISDAVKQVQPDAIAHLGAIIPPVAYAIPKVSERVNVDGTRMLMEAAQEMESPPRFVFASSYSIHGSRNPARSEELGLMTGETPRNPMDLYAAQKARCEEMLPSYAGEWCALRFGAILELAFGGFPPKAVFQFACTHPADQNRHSCDSRDVGLAVANACESQRDVNGKVLMIGGDDSWKMKAHDIINIVGRATGMGEFPKEISRKGDVENSSSWYFEDYMDTEESQRILEFQRYTVDDYVKEVSRRARYTKPFAKLFAPLIRAKMVGMSQYYKQNMLVKKGKAKAETPHEYKEVLLSMYPQVPRDFIVATPKKNEIVVQQTDSVQEEKQDQVEPVVQEPAPKQLPVDIPEQVESLAA